MMRGTKGRRDGGTEGNAGRSERRDNAILNSEFFILHSRSAFSLLELMIAIVILGLGLIMVAAMFPVAWDRARDLSEHTTGQAVAGSAHATVASLVEPAQVAGSELMTGASTKCSKGVRQRVMSAGLAGDLIYDPDLKAEFGCDDPILPSDTRVHELHMENLPAVGNLPVAEEPWRLELVPDFFADNFCNDPSTAFCPGVGFDTRSFRTPQVRAFQRVYPPMDTWTGIPSDFAQLDNRRFCWAAFHRMRRVIGPLPGVVIPPPGQVARTEFAEPRTFDMYYVTLRRPQPTNRYARQDASAVPDPVNLAVRPTVTPQALPADDDLLLPVAWRVQVQFPDNTVIKPAANATGTPTEVEVPPPNFPGTTSAKQMLVQMFPVGTKFIDEISGLIYTVAQRRVLGADGDKAFLTLDKEVVVEDLDAPADHPCTVSAVCIRNTLDPEEQLRTVWVFPPAVEDRPKPAYPLLDGTTPVVDITVRTLTLTPNAQ